MKSFSQFFAVVLYFFCVPEVTAQTLSPAPAINPSLGRSWSKADFPSIDKEKTPLFLHYKLQKSDLLPTSRTKVIEQSPLISENSGYETIQIYR